MRYIFDVPLFTIGGQQHVLIKILWVITHTITDMLYLQVNDIICYHFQQIHKSYQSHISTDIIYPESCVSIIPRGNYLQQVLLSYSLLEFNQHWKVISVILVINTSNILTTDSSIMQEPLYSHNTSVPHRCASKPLMKTTH